MKKEKEYVWELEGYSGSIWAKSYAEARKKLKDEISLQEANPPEEEVK